MKKIIYGIFGFYFGIDYEGFKSLKIKIILCFVIFDGL